MLGLSAYLIGFSLAYRGLDAGTGALVLFGMVQVTMFAGALVSREAVPARRWAGAGLALGGLALIAAPGAVPPGPLGLMALAGVGWGIYSLAGRGAGDPLAATAWNFVLAVPVVLPLGLAAGFEVPDATGVWLAVVSGAVTSGLGYALWYTVLPGAWGGPGGGGAAVGAGHCGLGRGGPVGRGAGTAVLAGVGAGAGRRGLGQPALQVLDQTVKDVAGVRVFPG